jgi:hypothetical protein
MAETNAGKNQLDCEALNCSSSVALDRYLYLMPGCVELPRHMGEREFN